MKTMYVVVRYSTYGFNIYTKTHSDKAKMVTYYEEQKTKHNDDIVILVTRDTAKVMEKVWYNIHRNYGKVLRRIDKIKSALGHKCEEE